MRNYGKIEHPKDVPTKEYVDGIKGMTPLKEWELLEDVTFTETVESYSLDLLNRNFKEVYFEGIILSADTTTQNQNFVVKVADGFTLWQNSAAFGVAKIYAAGTILLSPSKTYVADVTISRYGYTLSGASFRTTGILDASYATGSNMIPRIILQVAGQFAEGTKIKVWGR